MNNIPKAKVGIVAVSRDCFPASLAINRRKALMDAMDQAGFEYAKPDGTFYMFVKTPMEDDKEFVKLAKEKYQILCSSGAAFDCPGYVRFAYCVSYDMIVRATPNIIALGKELGMTK